MTFSYNARNEVAKLPLENECCYLSELSAIIRSSAEYRIENSKFAIVIKTEIANLYSKINEILEKLYGFSVELEIADDENFLHNVRYEIKINTDYATQVLKDCGIISLTDNFETVFNDGVDKYVVMSTCCKKSYIRGAFIACSTNNIVLSDFNDKTSKNTGYHLEFVFSSDELAENFTNLLAEFEIMSKKTSRKGNHIVYLKEGEVISDLLALVGAGGAVLDLQNEITLRSLRNTINRQNNCDTGNISKTVEASIKHITAIKIIQETIGLEELTIGLQEAAMLRIANPEESLDRLVKLSPKPITKSGLSHRFRKIIAIANELK